MAFKMKKKTERFASWLLVISGLVFGSMIFDFNPVIWFGNLFEVWSMWVVNIVYGAFAVSALAIGWNMFKNK